MANNPTIFTGIEVQWWLTSLQVMADTQSSIMFHLTSLLYTAVLASEEGRYCILTIKEK